jgi:hypothetical protein
MTTSAAASSPRSVRSPLRPASTTRHASVRVTLAWRRARRACERRRAGAVGRDCSCPAKSRLMCLGLGGRIDHHHRPRRSQPTTTTATSTTTGGYYRL